MANVARQRKRCGVGEPPAVPATATTCGDGENAARRAGDYTLRYSPSCNPAGCTIPLDIRVVDADVSVAFFRDPTWPLSIEIGSVYAPPGATAAIEVRLDSDGRRIGTLRHLLTRPATLAFDTAAGPPDCAPGAAASESSFVYTPAGCAGEACIGIEARLTFAGPDEITAGCPGREYFVFQTNVSDAVPVTVLPGPACAGDCDRDGAVAVDELITAVGIALGGEDLLACPSAASSCRAEIGVADLVSAVNAGLSGCPTP